MRTFTLQLGCSRLDSAACRIAAALPSVVLPDQYLYQRPHLQTVLKRGSCCLLANAAQTSLAKLLRCVLARHLQALIIRQLCVCFLRVLVAQRCSCPSRFTTLVQHAELQEFHCPNSFSGQSDAMRITYVKHSRCLKERNAPMTSHDRQVTNP